VIAARSPSDAFECAIEACRIATHYMTPVILLTDGYIANAAEPWKVPDMSGYRPFPVKFFDARPAEGQAVMPYSRGDGLARPWIKPGTPGLEHRIGGIEKQPGTGNIDYSPAAHQEMTDTRVAKVIGVANSIPDQDVCIGREGAEIAVVGWGSTFGPIHQAVRRAIAAGKDVAHVHVRHIWPMPKNMSVLLKGFRHILVPEMNMGQFKTVLRDQFLVDAKSLTKVSGHPFRIAEIEAAIDATLGA
jgi:2-oxoglutarate ferredoxin oxidoreductase subunit alpha